MQTAVIQSQIAEYPGSLPLTASEAEQVPALASPYHVLVRILAVALNPNDHKMLTHFPRPGYGAGCDFCGIVERRGNLTGDNTEDIEIQGHDLDLGTRVCGTVFPYAPVDAGINTLPYRTSAFAQFVAVDARLLLRVPSSWTDLQGAALGGVGWSTVALACRRREGVNGGVCSPSAPGAANN
jgi:NADPH:quinone reductase-like Zn-dependent oxidoreductase